MRALQFWILLLGSSFVSILMIKQIFLSRDLNKEQRLLVETQETVSTGSAWEKAWQKLALNIYQVGPQDPGLVELLKRENVGIHSNPPAGAGSAPATPASSKTPVAPLHSAAP